MVSFSCDKCQNVFTKPKVARHFLSCRTGTVSCIDCSVVFDQRSVKGHKSCISEAEKYAPKNESTTECTPTFCGICKLALNGAVHALQHYESKKHRAAERKLKASQKQTKDEKKDPSPALTPTRPAEPVVVNIEEKADATEDAKKSSKKEVANREKKLGIKKAMKKILKKSPKQRLKRDGLISAMSVLLGKKSPLNLPELVDEKANASARFKDTLLRMPNAPPH